MSAPAAPSGDGDRPKQSDPMAAGFLAYEMELFTRVMTAFATDLMDQSNYRDPLTWRIEALAMLCTKASRMAKNHHQLIVEASGHGT